MDFRQGLFLHPRGRVSNQKYVSIAIVRPRTLRASMFFSFESSDPNFGTMIVFLESPIKILNLKFQISNLSSATKPSHNLSLWVADSAATLKGPKKGL